MTGPVALSDVLADAPVVKWIMAKVSSVQAGEHALTLDYQGGLIPHVAYLESYVPAVNDVVHALIDQRLGLIVIGKEVLRTPIPIPPPAAAVTVPSTGAASYHLEPTPVWVPGQVRQGPKVFGAFFYTQASMPSSLIGKPLSALEIQLNVAAGSQALSFVVHDNLDTSTPFTPVSMMYLHSVPTGTLQWVKLPLYWADRLLNPSNPGIGVGLASDLYTAVITSGGTLRFTPL